MVEEEQLNDFPLPTRQYKKVTQRESQKKPEDWKNKVSPWFCPVVDPDTGEKCNNLLRGYSELFYREYGMCEECFNKYNPNLKKMKEEALMAEKINEVE